MSINNISPLIDDIKKEGFSLSLGDLKKELIYTYCHISHLLQLFFTIHFHKKMPLFSKDEEKDLVKKEMYFQFAREVPI